jgi:hypothetical protein
MIPTEFTIEAHFEGKDPALRTLYHKTIEMLRSIGPVTAEPKKTCIHLVRRTAFGGIHFRKDHLLLEFKSACAIDDPAIAKSEQISANRWHHTVRLDSSDALTEKLRDWLRNAWEMSG